MALKKVKQSFGPSSEEHNKIKIYALITVIMIVGAIAFTLFPKGTSLQQCEGAVLSTNRDNCLLNIATSTKNSSICGFISGSLKIDCYTNIAKATNNESLCTVAATIDPSSGGECSLAIVNSTGDYTICGGISEPYKDKCFFKAATKASNLQLCGSISSSSIMAACNSTILLDQAYYTSNISYCARVSNSLSKSFIQDVVTNTSAVFANLGRNFSNILSELAILPGQNLSSRDLCYISLAYKLKSNTYCSYASQEGESLCNMVANQTAGNLSAASTNFTAMLNSCKQLTQYQSFCTTYVLLDKAVATRNVSICSGFPTFTSWQCYDSLAKTYSNATYCSYITNSTQNNECLLSIQIGSIKTS